MGVEIPITETSESIIAGVKILSPGQEEIMVEYRGDVESFGSFK
jgi:hypothetical protein